MKRTRRKKIYLQDVTYVKRRASKVMGKVCHHVIDLHGKQITCECVHKCVSLHICVLNYIPFKYKYPNQFPHSLNYFYGLYIFSSPERLIKEKTFLSLQR